MLYHLFLQYIYSMAIINSMGVGRARKSMGNVTYRTVRGRTIGSQRVQAGGAVTRVPTSDQSARRSIFSMISRFAALHSSDIKVSFDRTRYGSERNYFMRVNYDALRAALIGVSDTATDTEVSEAIANYAEQHPTAIYRVKRSGMPVEYLTGEWVTSSNPATGQVSIGGTVKASGIDAFQLHTGDALRIVGNNLSGPLSLVGTNTLGGSTTVYDETTAFDAVSKSDAEYSATVKAAVNNVYAVQVKVGATVIASYRNASGSQGDNPLG